MKKSIMITGASSGIGKALAREMANRGYRMAIGKPLEIKEKATVHKAVTR